MVYRWSSCTGWSSPAPTWPRWPGRLAAWYPVYVPDLPGFGRSEKPPEALDIPGLADSLSAWMRGVGLGRAVFVGNSMGCQVIAELAARRPGLAEKVVLQGPTMDPHARTVVRHAGRFLEIVPREPLSLLAVEALDLLRAGVGRSWRTFRYALEDGVEEKLPRIRVPALVVRGSRDRICPQTWAEEAAHLLPAGDLVVIPGAGHCANYDAPSEFARVVRAFLKGP